MNKAKKIFRYWRARLRPSTSLPFFWHVGKPNFGDDINPAFFRAAIGRDVRLQTRRNLPHFLGMGSILDRATSSSTVLGSGCLLPPVAGSLTPHHVVAVRGELSLAGLARPEGVLLGDPMVLLNLIAPFEPKKDGHVGFVPHVSELGRSLRMDIPGIKIINPSLEPWRVINEIAICSRIYSQSLHGLIVADALGIPNVWIAPGPLMAGDTFKFFDYFSTLDADKKLHRFDLETFTQTPVSAFNVGRYKHDKKIYLDAIRSAVTTQPQDAI